MASAPLEDSRHRLGVELAMRSVEECGMYGVQMRYQDALMRLGEQRTRLYRSEMDKVTKRDLKDSGDDAAH